MLLHRFWQSGFVKCTLKTWWHGIDHHGCCLQLMDVIPSVLTKWICKVHFESMMTWDWLLFSSALKRALCKRCLGSSMNKFMHAIWYSWMLLCRFWQSGFVKCTLKVRWHGLGHCCSYRFRRGCVVWLLGRKMKDLMHDDWNSCVLLHRFWQSWFVKCTLKVWWHRLECRMVRWRFPRLCACWCMWNPEIQFKAR